MADLWRGIGVAWAAALATLTVAGLAGQGGRLRALMTWVGAQLDWPLLIGRAALVFAEGVLPLIPLLAAGLVYGRARRDGNLVILAGTGHRPLQLWAPAVLLGLLSTGLTWAVAHGPVPRATAALGRQLDGAIADTLAQPGQATALPGGQGVLAHDSHGWWAAWGRPSAPWVLRAAEAAATPGALGAPWRISLGDAWLWGPAVRIRARRIELTGAPVAVSRRLAQFGPPNATPTAQLPRDRPHPVFVRHRRWAMGASGLAWALLGAGLGAGLAAGWALPVGAAAVALAYWVLRVGELAARAGFGSAAFAAWAPVLLLSLGAWLWLPRAQRRLGGG